MPGIKELETALFHAHVSRCTSYAGVCLLIYDHFLTFPDEVSLIWNRPTNVVSILFLVNRYITPLILAVDVYDKGGLTEQLSTQFCKIWFVAEGYVNFLLLAVFLRALSYDSCRIHLLMVMRVHVLYGKRQKVAYILYTAYALYFIATFSIIIAGMFQALKTFYAENQFLHVYWGQLVNYFWLVWVPALLLETLLFGLTAYKARAYSRDKMNIPVARTLYRDGFQYYIVIILCSLFPLLVWTNAPSTLHAMPKYAGMAIVNVMGFRLVPNLRRHTLESNRISVFESYEMTPSPSPRTTEFSDKRLPRTLGNSLPRFIGQNDSSWLANNATDSCLDLSQEKSKGGDMELGVNMVTAQVRAARSQRGQRPGAKVNLSSNLATPAAVNSQLELDTVSIQSPTPSK